MNRTELYTLKHKEMVEVHDALVRKIAAELKDFDNLYYEICNEPYFAGVADDWQAHISASLTEAEKDFPARHLIAQNIANGGKKIDKADPNVSIFNFHYATPPDTIELNYKLNKVFSDDETGFRGKDDVSTAPRPGNSSSPAARSTTTSTTPSPRWHARRHAPHLQIPRRRQRQSCAPSCASSTTSSTIHGFHPHEAHEWSRQRW
jgi:hypothetical protein